MKNVYIDELDDLCDEYNNKYHGTMEMKAILKKVGNIDNVKNPVKDNVQ